MGRHGGMAGLDGGLGLLGRVASRLGLSDAQKDQVKAIVQSHRDEWKALGSRAADARKALADAVAADTLDDNAIRQASAGVAAVEADMAVARAHARAEIFQVLTPAQQAQAKQMQAQMRQRVDGFRERMQKRFSGSR